GLLRAILHCAALSRRSRPSTYRRGCTCSVVLFTERTTTASSTLSLHDALPISSFQPTRSILLTATIICRSPSKRAMVLCRLVCADRKSTRLNSSHVKISYAVFCLKKQPVQRRHQLLRKERRRAQPGRARR